MLLFTSSSRVLLIQGSYCTETLCLKAFIASGAFTLYGPKIIICLLVIGGLYGFERKYVHIQGVNWNAIFFIST